MTQDFFKESKRLRDIRCKEKDSIILPILYNIPITDPASFKSIFMPCLYGKEKDIFVKEWGVPKTNIFVLERDKAVWKSLKNEGFQVTPKPIDASEGIDFIEAECNNFDLIYLDFYSQPGFNHFELLEKIFKFGMIKKGGSLILTFGRTRTKSSVKKLNSLLNSKDSIIPVKSYIDIAIEKTGFRQYDSILTKRYKSSQNNLSYHIFETTLAKF